MSKFSLLTKLLTKVNTSSIWETSSLGVHFDQWFWQVHLKPFLNAVDIFLLWILVLFLPFIRQNVLNHMTYKSKYKCHFASKTELSIQKRFNCLNLLYYVDWPLAVKFILKWYLIIICTYEFNIFNIQIHWIHFFYVLILGLVIDSF
jgi:hypothetical protein